MLTKSATPNASRRPAAERSEGAVPIWLADERREQVHARKGKSKIWRVRSNTQQVQVHARKEKSKVWRVRSNTQQAQVHARKGKSKIWRVRSNTQQAQVHARKEKARFGVCGATPNKFEKLSSLQTSRGMIHLYCAFCSE